MDLRGSLKMSADVKTSMPPLNREDQRRTDRSAGIRLLFGAAQDVARRKGQLGDGALASEAHSTLDRGKFKLRDNTERLLAVVPVQEARDALAYRRKLAHEAITDAGVELTSKNPTNQERGKLRVMNPELRALAWAVSTGRRIPYRRKQRWAPLIAIPLLLCGVIPGLIYLAWLWQRRRSSNRELAALVKRWQSAGRPEPEPSFFQLYGS